MNLTSYFIFFFILLFSYVSYAEISPQLEKQLTVIKDLKKEDPKAALSMIHSLRLEEQLSDVEQGELYYQQGLIEYKILHEKDKSILSFYKAMYHFRRTQNTERQYHTLSYLGMAHRVLQRNNYALEYFQEILALGFLDEEKVLFTEYNVAKSLRMLQAYDSAILIQTRLSKEFSERGMVKWQINSLLEIGLSSIELKDWKSAKISYQKVNELILTFPENNVRYEAKVLGSLGFIALKEGHYEEAESYFAQATPLMIQESDLSMLIIHYNDMALLEMEKGNQDRALEYLKKAIVLDPKEAGTAEVKNSLIELIGIYKSKNQETQALVYSEKLNEIAIPYIKLSQELETLHKQYQADRVHYIIKQFELEQAALTSENSARFYQLLAFTGLLLSIGVYFAWRTWWMRHRKQLGRKISAIVNEWEPKVRGY